MKVSKAVGIDLGTTNSVISMVGQDNEEIICRTDRSGRKTFPSVVVYDRRSDALQAGSPAFAKRGTPADPISSIKSHMGNSEYRAKTGPKSMSPVEVSTVILAEMKRQMQEYLEATPGYEDYVVDRAVITIPAYFAANAREATTKAAEQAGLKVEFTLQEPTASVLYYCQKLDIEDGVFLVYDLGGGTFDVSVVKVDGGDVVVLGIAGNNYLGGDNFDEALALFLLDDIKQDVEAGYDLDGFDPNHDPEDKRRLTKLKLVAESIKKSLSLKDEHYEEFANIFQDKSGALVNLALTVHREDFESLIRPVLESTIEECHKALAKAAEDYNISLGMVDAVLLVGGSTHVPLVAEVITEAFTSPSLPEGQRTKQPAPIKYESDMAVGYGAAIAAAGCGVANLDDVAYAIMSGDETVAETVPEDQLVVTANFGPASGYAGESLVEGKLEAVRGTLPDGVSAQVTRAGGGFDKAYPVNADGSFILAGLLAENDPEPYACKFVAGGEVIGESTFDAAIRNAPHATVTLSRSYYIETINADGQIELVELMRSGEALPITRDYEFATNPTNNYFAEMRFFEESDFLKQITLSFASPLPPGTPVKLSLSCDIQSRFSARAEAGGVVVDTQFEPSPAPPVPTKTEVDDLMRQARSKVDQISAPHERVLAKKQLDRLANEVDQAVDEDDSGKARDKMNDLRNLMKKAPTGPTELTPSASQFEALVARVEQANANSGKGDSNTAGEIQEAAGKGRAALAENNQGRLTQAVDDLEKIEKMLTQSDSDGGGGGGDRPPLWMLCQAFGQQVLDVIDQAEARTDLPESFRRDHLSTAVEDRTKIREAVQATKPPLPLGMMPPDWMSDEEAAPHFSVVTTIYQKWDRIKDMTGTVQQK
ncbi:MAG: Hsp70 family protein [Micrococcales bacterium]|nr:Hsp70 family protein [Micrococcales bacterium]